MYDVIIIGMGPAGLNAAIYAKRSGLNVLMLEKNSPGGLLNKTNIVNNYLGFENITGPDLAAKMFFHTQALEIPYRIEEVENILIENDKKIVITTESTFETKAIIICGGRQARKTSLKNESDLIGKGLSYCAVCDAPLYKNKNVAIIGGGNSAFEEGLYLADFVSSLTILYRGDKCKADEVLQEKVKERNNITVKLNSEVEEVILKDNKINKLVLKNKEELEVEGLFIYIGFEPSTGYLKNVNILTPNNYIEVDENMRTKVSGIYAAGDTVKKELYQIITAASEGAIAAMSCKKDIDNL